VTCAAAYFSPWDLWAGMSGQPANANRGHLRSRRTPSVGADGSPQARWAKALRQPITFVAAGSTRTDKRSARSSLLTKPRFLGTSFA
jgi:hypothetical protein